jgi:hypothetical protein
MRMNAVKDEWGYDPSVQWARKLFRLMEKAQRELIGTLKLSAFDAGLKPARESALAMYHRACSSAAGERLGRDENAYAALYARCFVRALQTQGIEIPDNLPATHPDHADWLRDFF